DSSQPLQKCPVAPRPISARMTPAKPSTSRSSAMRLRCLSRRPGCCWGACCRRLWRCGDLHRGTRDGSDRAIPGGFGDLRPRWRGQETVLNRKRCGLSPVVDAELGVDDSEMALDRGFGEKELC